MGTLLSLFTSSPTSLADTFFCQGQQSDSNAKTNHRERNPKTATIDQEINDGNKHEDPYNEVVLSDVIRRRGRSLRGIDSRAAASQTARELAESQRALRERGSRGCQRSEGHGRGRRGEPGTPRKKTRSRTRRD